VSEVAATAGPDDERPRWLSITGAAVWVSLSAKTICRKVAAGELRAYRCGKTIRIKTDDLEAMMRPVPSAKDW
jgi:excisionase family DNA binding protein